MSSQPPIITGVTVQAPSRSIPPGWNLNGLFFDAWLKLQHTTVLTSTNHPVERRAAISDHSYVEPFRGSFDIGMTDCVSSFVAGQFPASPTRSINAYNTLVDLQASGQFLTLDTKYAHYSNILIESISVDDDYQTVNALKATINLKQIIVADAQFIKITSNQHVTSTTPRGQVSAQPIPGSLEAIKKDLEELGTSDGFNQAALNFLGRL